MFTTAYMLYKSIPHLPFSLTGSQSVRWLYGCSRPRSGHDRISDGSWAIRGNRRTTFGHLVEVLTVSSYTCPVGVLTMYDRGVEA